MDGGCFVHIYKVASWTLDCQGARTIGPNVQNTIRKLKSSGKVRETDRRGGERELTSIGRTEKEEERVMKPNWAGRLHTVKIFIIWTTQVLWFNFLWQAEGLILVDTVNKISYCLTYIWTAGITRKCRLHFNSVAYFLNCQLNYAVYINWFSLRSGSV
jgi:hypothetical protein